MDPIFQLDILWDIAKDISWDINVDKHLFISTSFNSLSYD